MVAANRAVAPQRPRYVGLAAAEVDFEPVATGWFFGVGAATTGAVNGVLSIATEARLARPPARSHRNGQAVFVHGGSGITLHGLVTEVLGPLLRLAHPGPADRPSTNQDPATPRGATEG